jgi:DNA repair photolyase
VAPADPHYLRRVLRRALAADLPTPSGVLAAFLRRRVPIHFGGMSDPFQPAERRHHVSLQYLIALRDFEYPTVISTRGTLIGQEPYCSLLRDMRVAVQFSFTSTRPRLARAFEPRVAPPTKLLRVMAALASHGIPVSCRWQPYLRGHCEPQSEFVRRVTEAGARHVALEHLKIPLEQTNPLWDQLSEAARHDLRAEYRAAGGIRDGREYVLPPERKLDDVLRTRDEAHRQSATFGAADNEFQYLSDTACCCSGVDRLPGFENWFAHQIGHAVRLCRGQAQIRYEAIAGDWVPQSGVDRWLNSRTRIMARTGASGTIQDHLRQRWNDPGSRLGPALFYGVEASDDFTPEGYRVYRWSATGLALLHSAGLLQPGPGDNERRSVDTAHQPGTRRCSARATGRDGD